MKVRQQSHDTPASASKTRTPLLAGLLLLATVTLADRNGALEPLRARLHRADPAEPTVMLVVLDTVRADHLSLCGYRRPTTPTLESLRERGAVHSCRAYAPGSWTLPSHASYFTGLPVYEHGAHFSSQGEHFRSMMLHPLPPDVPTLAEKMRERGYQTAGVAGNSVLTESSGLARGFETWHAPVPGDGPWFGDRLLPRLRETLRRADGSGKPLFLFVNIMEAHDPWPDVPAGLGWVPPTQGLAYFRSPRPDPWERYVTGQLGAAEADTFRTRITDLYDHALSKADAVLAQVLNTVEAYGWTSAGLRLIVVSDHGEFLGEHGLARHGRYLWEANNRVPLLVYDTTSKPELPPDPVSALDVFALVTTGRIASPTPPEAVAYPDSFWLERSRGRVGGSTSVAMWRASEKLLWKDGELTRFDVADDASEQNPAQLTETRRHERLSLLIAAVQRSGARGGEIDPRLAEALRTVGYIE
jgi:hypothetical protein